MSRLLVDDLLNISNIKDVKEKVFNIFDEIKLLSVGFNVFQDPKSSEKWELLKDKYYRDIKTLLVYEMEINKSDVLKKPNIQ